MSARAEAERSFVLARLRREDLARCAELERVLFPGDDPWRESVFHSELDQGHYYLGAYLPAEPSGEVPSGALVREGPHPGGRLVGYAGLAVIGRPPVAEASVQTIAVDPEWQGRGVGRALLRALLDRADAFEAVTFLEVRTDNEPALALYRGHGFEIVGLRRGYYQPSGADAYTMRRPRVTAQGGETG